MEALFNKLNDRIPGCLEQYSLAVRTLYLTGVWVVFFLLAATISTMEKLCGMSEEGLCRPLRVCLCAHDGIWIIVTGDLGYYAQFHGKPFNGNIYRSHDPLPYLHHLALPLLSRWYIFKFRSSSINTDGRRSMVKRGYDKDFCIITGICTMSYIS